MPRGTLIVLEGLDKAGKSTQCDRLIDNLRQQGHRISLLKFPDRTTAVGQMINGYLQGKQKIDDHVIHLLFSANRWELACKPSETIIHAISAGETLVLDRYIYSGCVYSVAKHVPGLELEYARWPDVGLPRPDVCIFLDVSAEVAAKRGDWGTEVYEKKEMQKAVRELFHGMSEKSDRGDFVFVDADRSMDEVEVEVLQHATAAIESVERGDHGDAVRKIEPYRPR